MSNVIRSEELSDCQAWSLPEVQSGGNSHNQPVTARRLEKIQEQAHREGYQQGLQEGREKGGEELLNQARHLEQIIKVLDKPLEDLDDSIEQQLAQLAMLVARQLVRRELKADPQQVVGVVRDALAALPVAARDVQLALNPEDAGIVREALSLHEGEQAIRIVEDPVQSRGGCRVVTRTSQIDATVETRLNSVIADVLGGQRHTDSPEADAGD
ncbi:MAG TPA: flagellar assembly protein FliH [Gammaproteobacteria bacterium]|nr:flagellar assembly protein FliH [Gammaproteobacteria bacterium]